MKHEQMDWHEFNRAMRERSQEKRANNREQSRKMLEQHGIAFQEKNAGAYLIIRKDGRRFDFWPGTGKWVEHGGAMGRGVRTLIKQIEAKKATT